MKRHLRTSRLGFTVVELIVVIVCIGILASITVIAYNGAQAKARDAARTDSIVKIKDALELYYAKNGRYPSATASPGASDWEASTDTPGSFLEQLYGYGVNESTIDPLNKTVKGVVYGFYYYRYAAVNSYGCDQSKGAFYVLRATYENAANRPPVNDIPDTECTGSQASWKATPNTKYVTHKYETD